VLLHKTLLFVSAASFFCLPCMAQTPITPTASSPCQERIMRLMKSSTGAWTADQIATMARLRDAAQQDSDALAELRHLTDNIGPRPSGSPQAQQAVEYVAAEMRALGAEVRLEKTVVPHWVRGAEIGELLNWPGQTPGTSRKFDRHERISDDHDPDPILERCLS
jgi:carboxypeptidase Q